MTLKERITTDQRTILSAFICALRLRYQRSILLGVPLAKPRVGLSATSPRRRWLRAFCFYPSREARACLGTFIEY